jgi:enoyl-CoA hydratase/carnithine racemase
MESKDFGRVRYEKDGAIARLVLTWPEKANKQDSKMVWAMDDALREADRDYEVKVLIIKAEGKGFSAGHAMGAIEDDYPEMAEDRAATGTQYKSSADLFLWPVLKLWEFPKPTIAQVHGYALGAGSYWALIPDITIASDDAYFQMPLPQAVGFPTGETMIEPWVFMNYKRSAEYLFQSKTLSAAEAHAWGAVNQVVPRAELEKTVEDMAARIARAPLSTLMMTKSLNKRAWELMGMRSHMQMSTDLLELATHCGDVKEHMAKMAALSGNKPRQAMLAAEKDRGG